MFTQHEAKCKHVRGMMGLRHQVCLHNTRHTVNTRGPYVFTEHTTKCKHCGRSKLFTHQKAQCKQKNEFTDHNTQCAQIYKHMLSTQHEEQCKHRLCLHCTTHSVNYGLQNSRPPPRPTHKFKMIGSTGPAGVAVLCAAQSQTARSWAVSPRAIGGSTP